MTRIGLLLQAACPLMATCVLLDSLCPLPASFLDTGTPMP